MTRCACSRGEANTKIEISSTLRCASPQIPALDEGHSIMMEHGALFMLCSVEEIAGTGLFCHLICRKRKFNILAFQL